MFHRFKFRSVFAGWRIRASHRPVTYTGRTYFAAAYKAATHTPTAGTELAVLWDSPSCTTPLHMVASAIAKVTP